ncbi:MAG: pyridoxamine 5-phosphate oxidase [Deltaproteobacteria bacterium]|nr:pyridoxamine 5-phosphate oxidase [Deltaproteobacteria bacterium]
MALPADVVKTLDGTNLESRSSEAIRLITVGKDGWPHAAQLSVGEVLAVSPTELLVATWPNSHTTQNLRRDGRLTLAVVANGAVLEMCGHAMFETEHQTKRDLAVFRVKIQSVHEHRATYADVTSGVTFRLHDREHTLARWRDQVETLRKLA